MRESQDILQQYFGVRVTTFVPPGNVFTLDTVDAAREFGIERINCSGHAGRKIPLTVTYHKKTKLDGNAHVLLYGYGSYGYSIGPSFSSSR